MFRTAAALIRIAALLSVFGAVALCGCTDRVTMPSETPVSLTSPADGRPEVHQPYRIEDPNVPVDGR